MLNKDENWVLKRYWIAAAPLRPRNDATPVVFARA